MEIMIFNVLKRLIAFIFLFLFCFSLLFLSRIALYFEIEESTGRRVFRNKKKKNKEYPKEPHNIRWFFLLDYLHHIRRWHYAFFILDALFTIVLLFIFVTITIIGWSPLIKEIGKPVFLIWMLLKVIIYSFPKDKHQSKKKKFR